MNDRDRIQSDSPQSDDEFDSTLISYDEAIARGAEPGPLCERPERSELEQRLKRGMACVQLLERFWPRGGSYKTNVAQHGRDMHHETGVRASHNRAGDTPD